jgi:hypothetical protein
MCLSNQHNQAMSHCYRVHASLTCLVKTRFSNFYLPLRSKLFVSLVSINAPSLRARCTAERRVARENTLERLADFAVVAAWSIVSVGGLIRVELEGGPESTMTVPSMQRMCRISSPRHLTNDRIKRRSRNRSCHGEITSHLELSYVISENATFWR